MASHDVEFIADLKPRVVVLSRGKVLADGKSQEILTDGGLLKKASLLPPQLVSILERLGDLGVQRKVLDVDVAAGIIADVLRHELI